MNNYNESYMLCVGIIRSVQLISTVQIHCVKNSKLVSFHWADIFKPCGYFVQEYELNKNSHRATSMLLLWMEQIVLYCNYPLR